MSERLASTRAAVVWKGYTTFHYAGETGAFTGVRRPGFIQHLACSSTKLTWASLEGLLGPVQATGATSLHGLLLFRAVLG